MLHKVVDSIVVVESVGCTMWPVIIHTIIKLTLSNCSPLLLRNVLSLKSTCCQLVNEREKLNLICLLGGIHNQEYRLYNCERLKLKGI